MRIRNDLLKYRTELFKYDPLIVAAQEREEDFSVTSRWSFFVIGAEDRIIADVRFGWSGILAKKPCPQVTEFIVCLEDPGLQDIVQEKIELLYGRLPWVPALPIRYLNPDDFYYERPLPQLDGWYDPDTGKIHYCIAFQCATGMPMLHSRCGKMHDSYYFFGDPLPYVEPDFAGDVCKSCLRAVKDLAIYKPEVDSATVEARIHLGEDETFEDVLRQIQTAVLVYKKHRIKVEYIHVEIFGASWSLLLANECVERVRQFCLEAYPEIESYANFV
jgi:hypothetical protein